MITATLKKNENYKFYYQIAERENTYFAGLSVNGFLEVSDNCPYKEFALRTLINKCMNDFIFEVKSTCDFDVDLRLFGFTKEKTYFVAKLENLKLPHFCK